MWFLRNLFLIGIAFVGLFGCAALADIIHKDPKGFMLSLLLFGGLLAALWWRDVARGKKLKRQRDEEGRRIWLEANKNKLGID